MEENKKEEAKQDNKEEEKTKSLSSEFKDGIEKEGKGSNLLNIIVTLVFIVIIFGSMGIAAYEIFYKPEKIETKSSEEKIESRPDSGGEITETTVTTVVAETTTTTTKAASGAKEYTVISGDTLGAIATKYSTTVEALMSYNGITDETSLQIDQVIKIP